MKISNLPINNEHHLYGQIKDILTSARAKAYSAVNFAMVEASYAAIGGDLTTGRARKSRVKTDNKW